MVQLIDIRIQLMTFTSMRLLEWMSERKWRSKSTSISPTYSSEAFFNCITVHFFSSDPPYIHNMLAYSMYYQFHWFPHIQKPHRDQLKRCFSVVLSTPYSRSAPYACTECVHIKSLISIYHSIPKDILGRCRRCRWPHEQNQIQERNKKNGE